MPQNDFSLSALLACDSRWRYGLRLSQEASPVAHTAVLRALAAANHWRQSLRATWRALDAALAACEVAGGLEAVPELLGRMGGAWRQLKGRQKRAKRGGGRAFRGIEQLHCT